MAEFRGAAGKRPDLGKPRVSCQGAWTLPRSDEPLAGSDQGNDTVIFGFRYLEPGFLARVKASCPPLLGVDLRGSVERRLSAHMLKSGCLDLNPRSDACWLCGLKEDTSLDPGFCICHSELNGTRIEMIE